ncbi:hypothetical protein AGABI1DRAFT_131808 [Agaricus bisporus var. burnettii JB137-S8]|uniref:Fungal-type protein kinase domain-containing protein n=1 Tax=Agaricus bisporus var. burnettii (strain JB137-S8 / ATCC MYA-4627 / FGSC 10392) TaxID=597362 RepID=K5VN72_AGABU|nr:uncharacterized protein AGABI1DRAFT_131808 [Agaricus bisporus var. burnettii JB137-S8]EKM75909.1 hypothetical protein AGABI1DRAFT_131808 [Agaricus bisporus var. burnettii JB137-S8]
MLLETAHKKPLDPTLLHLNEQDAEFFKSQTRIRDDEALKNHIIEVQRKAYEIHHYRCIQNFSFTRRVFFCQHSSSIASYIPHRLKISRLPAYEHVLQLQKTRPGAILLDIGCCFGNDLRKAVADGWPVENAIGSDIHGEFWSYGHELFKSNSETFPAGFVAGDAFSPAMIEPRDPFYSPPASPRPTDLKILTSLIPLQGHVSVLHTSLFFHLFDEDQQLALAKQLSTLLSPEPGSIMFGIHGGEHVKSTRPSNGREMFCHSPESWTSLWDGTVFAKGTVKVEASVVEFPPRDSSELKFSLLVWSKVEGKLAKTRRTLLLHYRDCSVSEVSGTNIRVDAYLTEQLDGPSENADSRPKRVDLADIAVPIEFKKHLKDRVQNRHHLITDALEILNDDPCRTWIYGLAIENTVMSIWYFSRSHTVVSTSFDFTKDIKSFIYVFLSLMYATRVEIGYDPTVHRVLEDKRIRYVYEVEYNGERRYFKTLETLYTSRVLRITVRKTRVWKAIEVEGYDDKKFRKEKKGGKVVALKDYWLDEGSKSEKDTLEDIFRSLEQVKHKPTTLKWAKSEFHQNFFREQLEEERYRKYFMGIECDMVLAATKPRLPSAQPVPDILVPEENTKPASVNKATGSIQTSDSVFELAYMIYQRGGRTSLKRKYRTKRHHRLIYEQVGRPLLAATYLSTSLRSLTDALIALTLMYIAGYVHRDVSTGNIIFVEESNGTIMGKLSDMEYAKVFQNDESNSDPKTGTLFFMAIEIHSGKSLYVAPDNEDDIRSESPPPSFDLAPRNQDLRNSFLEPAENLHPGKQMRPKFRFSHDMESWMWVTLYILTRRIPRQDVGQRDDHRDQFFNHVYTNSNVPTNEREQVIRMEDHKFQSFLEYHFPPAITGFAKHLAFFRKELKSSASRMSIPEINFDPIVGARPPSPQPESQHKRQRTHEEQDDDDYTAGTDDDIPVENRPVRKQPRRGRMQLTQAHASIGSYVYA